MTQKIIVTIDTEGHDGKDPVEKLIWGRTENGTFGIERIMDEFEKIGAHILFFLDFAEVWDYGEKKIQEVADCILSRGHNIGVHIHPDHMADKNRVFLWEYSYEEQKEMIQRCTEMYEKIVGKKPLSFRAGKYSANIDTLDILNDLGYKYDFSEFYSQKWCGIDPPITVNSPVKYKNIVEFPVTMHRSIKVFNFSRYDKIDIENMLPSELRYALQQVAKQNFKVVTTLFFHSFSLMDWADSPDDPKLSEKKVNKLQEALKTVSSNKELELIQESDLDSIEPVSSEAALNSMIQWDSFLKGLFFSYQKLIFIAKRNRKAKLILVFARFIEALIVFLMILLLL